MVTVCAWCQRYLGSKEPYSNPAVSHGICPTCQERESRVESPVLVVSPDRAATLPVLEALLQGAPGVAIVVDRRGGERRHGHSRTNGKGNGNGHHGSPPPNARDRRLNERRRNAAPYVV